MGYNKCMASAPVKRLPVLGIILAVAAWVVFIWINSTSNQAPFSKAELGVGQGLLFLGPLVVALTLTLWLPVHNIRRSILASVLFCGLLGLRLYDFTSPITVLFLFLVVGGIEWYVATHKRQKPRHVSYGVPSSHELRREE